MTTCSEFLPALEGELRLCKIARVFVSYVLDPLAITLILPILAASLSGTLLSIVSSIAFLVLLAYIAIDTLFLLDRVYVPTLCGLERGERRLLAWCVRRVVSGLLGRYCLCLCEYVKRAYRGDYALIGLVSDAVRRVLGVKLECIMDPDELRRVAIRECPFCVIA